jgi:hypothetical protein
MFTNTIYWAAKNLNKPILREGLASGMKEKDMLTYVLWGLEDSVNYWSCMKLIYKKGTDQYDLSKQNLNERLDALHQIKSIGLEKYLKDSHFSWSYNSEKV